MGGSELAGGWRFIKLMYLDISWPLSDISVRICLSQAPCSDWTQVLLFFVKHYRQCNFGFPLIMHCTWKPFRVFKICEYQTVFSEVIESYVWGEQGTNFIAGKFEQRCFKVDGFCNADKGKEAGCLLKLWGVSDRIVWLNNTCQHSARVETKDMSSSRSWQC